MSWLNVSSVCKSPEQTMAFPSVSQHARSDPRRRPLALLALAVALFVLAVLARVAHAQEDVTVGRIGRIAGEVTLIRGTQSMPASSGMAVRQEDAVATGADGRVEVVFNDGSILALGSGTSVSIAAYAAPSSGAGRALLDLIDGILRLSLAPGRSWRSFELRSATAVASVRSTDWIVDASRASTAVFVVEGRVAVDSRAGLGGIVLEAGQGTDVRAGEAPTAPKTWGQKRVDDVLARTRLP